MRIPNTKKAMKNVYRRTAKRVRIFVKDTTGRVKKVPAYVDRRLSRAIRRVSRSITRKR